MFSLLMTHFLTYPNSRDAIASKNWALFSINKCPVREVGGLVMKTSIKVRFSHIFDQKNTQNFLLLTLHCKHCHFREKFEFASH